MIGTPPGVPDRPGYTVVIPTVGRASLQACLDALAGTAGRHDYPPRQVIVADDRRDTPDPLPVAVPPLLADRTRVVTLEGRGPAAARNAGWQAAEPAEWVVFLDDDVRVSADWARDLAADLSAATPDIGGVQGTLMVPWPSGTRPADSQRATLGLADAAWITADMAYRHAALADAGGFDERFPRAYREDSDLALRITERGWTLRRGSRRTVHPVPAPRLWASIRAQAGNADDAAMRQLHGRNWRRRAGAPPGRRRTHAVTCAAGGAALVLFAVRALALTLRRPGPADAPTGRAGPPDALTRRAGPGAADAVALATGRAAAASAATWAVLTAEFATRRIAAGPRTGRDVTAMLVTSALIPPMAAWHWLRASWTWRNAGPWPPKPGP